MTKETKIELLLEGLHCANCVAKIETKINELDNVKLAGLNFVTKTLIIEVDETDKILEVIADTKEIIKKYEPNVVLRKKT